MKQMMEDDRDKVIRNKLKEDKIISAPTLETYDHYINDNRIRMKKYTNGQKHLILFLLLVLLVSVGINVKFLFGDEILSYLGITKKEIPITMNTTTVVLNEDDEDEDLVKYSNTTNATEEIENTIDEEVENTIENTTSHKGSLKKTDIFKQDNSSEYDVDAEEMTKLLNDYSFVIGRINNNELETNTAILEFATRFLERGRKEDKSTTTVSTKFSKNLDNYAKVIREVTGIEMDSNFHYLNNYFKYSQSSNSYMYGNDYSKLSLEKEQVTEFKVYSYQNNVYKGTYLLHRTYTDFEKDYKVIITFSENKNYEYSRYKIASIEVEPMVKDLDKSLRLFDTYGLDINAIEEAIVFEMSKSSNKYGYTPIYAKVYYVAPSEVKDKHYDVEFYAAYQDNVLVKYEDFTGLFNLTKMSNITKK